jgi:hypothetical protein
VKILDFENQSVIVRLDPTDCFVLAEACTASITYDQATNLTLAEALAAAFTAAGLAAAATCQLGRPAQEDDYSLAVVRKAWMPHDDRLLQQPPEVAD